MPETDDGPVVKAARCAFEVVAGLLPGQPMDEYTKRFFMTSDDPAEKFQELYTQAREYAETLIDPSQLNWVKLEWVWF
jgi:hypothetical protein